MDYSFLPAYLRMDRPPLDQPLEVDQLPLQVFLLTAELGMQRRRMMQIAATLRSLADILTTPRPDLELSNLMLGDVFLTVPDGGLTK